LKLSDDGAIVFESSFATMAKIWTRSPTSIDLLRLHSAVPKSFEDIDSLFPHIPVGSAAGSPEVVRVWPVAVAARAAAAASSSSSRGSENGVDVASGRDQEIQDTIRLLRAELVELPRGKDDDDADSAHGDDGDDDVENDAAMIALLEVRSRFRFGGGHVRNSETWSVVLRFCSHNWIRI